MACGRAVEGGMGTGAGRWLQGTATLVRESWTPYGTDDEGRFRLRDERGFSCQGQEADELEELAQRIGRRPTELHAAEQDLLEWWIAEYGREVQIPDELLFRAWEATEAG
jgi:hypothetical protein